MISGPPISARFARILSSQAAVELNGHLSMVHAHFNTDAIRFSFESLIVSEEYGRHSARVDAIQKAKAPLGSSSSSSSQQSEAQPRRESIPARRCRAHERNDKSALPRLAVCASEAVDDFLLLPFL